MSNERAELLIKAIDAYGDKEELFKMSIEDAVKALNAEGNDITADEMKEISDALKAAVDKMDESGELDENELSNVAGGAMAVSLNMAAVRWGCEFWRGFFDGRKSR